MDGDGVAASPNIAPSGSLAQSLQNGRDEKPAAPGVSLVTEKDGSWPGTFVAINLEIPFGSSSPVHSNVPGVGHTQHDVGPLLGESDGCDLRYIVVDSGLRANVVGVSQKLAVRASFILQTQEQCKQQMMSSSVFNSTFYCEVHSSSSWHLPHCEGGLSW